MGPAVPSADAAGFHIFEWDNRANGMGGAVIASPNANPATIAYNPAAMTQLEGVQTAIGTTLIAPSAELTTDGYDTVQTKDKVYVVPNAYLTWQMTDDFWFGIGEFSRFGLGTNYDHDWFGAYNVYKAAIETVSINPNVAYKASDELSVAAGVEVVFGKMDLRQHPIVAPVVNQDIHMFPEGIGWTWNIGTYWQPNDVVSIGVNYRKGFAFKGRGDIDAYNISNPDLDLTEDDQMTLSAQFPGTLSGGIAFRFTDKLTMEFDALYTTWSEFETMEYDFDSHSVAAVTAITSLNSTSQKQYHNSLRLQMGAEYEALSGVFLRAGYVYDPSPQNPEFMDYMLPANDRQIVSTGLGIAWDNLQLDFSYMYLWSHDYVIDNDGTGILEPTKVTNGVTHIGGLNLSYQF